MLCSLQTARDFTIRMEKAMRDIYGEDVIPLSVTGYVEAPLAYDAVWALALALNKSQTRYCAFNIERIIDCLVSYL